MRIFKHHNLSSRVVTIKIRKVVPAKHEEKLEAFKLILSLNVCDHKVSDALIAGMDETNTMFVPQIPKTHCPTIRFCQRVYRQKITHGRKKMHSKVKRKIRWSNI